jgi:hypothetical protein
MLNIMALYLAPRLKKGHHQIWEANLQPLGPIFQHFIEYPDIIVLAFI